jgi:threonine synthase
METARGGHDTTREEDASAPAIQPGWHLTCPRCGFASAPALFAHGCPDCLAGGEAQGLVVAYDGDGATLPPAPRTAAGVWKAGALLPRIAPRFAVTLGEGDTPLVHVPALSAASGCERLFLKLELANPTAAHKDRFHAVSLGVGRALGYTKVVSSSTGNHGLSMASYAAAHGMRAVVVCDERMPPLLQRAIRFVGGLPLQLPADEGLALLAALVDEDGWYPSTSSWPMPVANPFGVEGYKTIAYELYHDLDEAIPDLVFAPSAAGDGLVGLWRGMDDLRRLGITSRLPRLCTCQPTEAAPLVAALAQGLESVARLPRAFSRALSIGDPISGGLAVRAVRESDGFGVAVDDEVIEETGRLLAANGLIVETASAAAVAGTLKALREQPALRQQTVVCLVTSSGLKWLDDYGDASATGADRVASVADARRLIADRMA